ncbi:hypothetical protein P879_05396 [Paragonimus westermani]|uniref:Uncharacterized protein n=1 Tax=Paragonimus westermani TaxID=34504 RepID=A0A8T0DT30_9TREM|nr:hypothetical protein P879_05396 [Paragonimus westermani]
MRGRRSSLDISWECLNAVRPELVRVKTEEPSQQSQMQQPQTILHQVQQPQQSTPHVTESDTLDQFQSSDDLNAIVTSDLNSL